MDFFINHAKESLRLRANLQTLIDTERGTEIDHSKQVGHDEEEEVKVKNWRRNCAIGAPICYSIATRSEFKIH